jgi:hypothetical protein
LKLIVNFFGIIDFLLTINSIAFWDKAPCNLVDYRSAVGEYVTWDACISGIYFDLCAFPLLFFDVRDFIHQNLSANQNYQKNASMIDFFKEWKIRN